MLIDLELGVDVGVELDARMEADAAGDGMLVPKAMARWKREAKRLIGYDVRVTLMRWKVRTPPQNRLYWRLLTELLWKLTERCSEVGERCPFKTKEDLHEFFKSALIGTTVATMLGERVEIPPSSAKLTVPQFSAYVEAIVARAASWSVYLPMPGDLMREEIGA